MAEDVKLFIEAVLNDTAFKKGVADMTTTATTGLGGKLKGAIDKLKGSWLGVTAAVGGTIAAFTASVKQAIDAEKASLKLTQALKNNGTYSDELKKSYDAQAQALSKLNAVEDEEVTNAQAVLTMFGVQSDKMKELTQATIDFAKAKGMGLAEAANIVGKSISGEVDTLGRYGASLEGAKGSVERTAKAIQVLNERFGGQAQAQIQGIGGTFEKLKTTTGELSERLGTFIGKLISPAVNMFNEAIYELFISSDDVNEITTDLIANYKEYNDVTRKLAEGVDTLSEAEKRNLRAKQQLIRLDIVKDLEKLNKEWGSGEQYRADTIDWTSKAMIYNYKKQRDAIVDAISLAEKQEKKTIPAITGITYRTMSLNDARKKLAEITGYLTKEEEKSASADSDRTEKFRELAKAYADGILTTADFAMLNDTLRERIIASATAMKYNTEEVVKNNGAKKILSEQEQKNLEDEMKRGVELKAFKDEQAAYLKAQLDQEYIDQEEYYRKLDALYAMDYNAYMDSQDKKKLATAEFQKMVTEMYEILYTNIEAGLLEEELTTKDVLKNMLKDFTNMVAKKLQLYALEYFTLGFANPINFGIAAMFQTAAIGAKTIAAGFAKGTSNVPSDMIAQVHEGERIIPANMNIPGMTNEQFLNSTLRGIGSASEGSVSNTTNNQQQYININGIGVNAGMDTTIGELLDMSDRMGLKVFNR